MNAQCYTGSILMEPISGAYSQFISSRELTYLNRQLKRIKDNET